MKSFLKYILTNRTVILCTIDFAIIFWIIWFENRLEYEPLLDYTSSLEDRCTPLMPQVYNVMIIAIVANIIVSVGELRKKRTCHIKWDIAIGTIYFCLISFCMLLGYYHISTKSHNLIIYEGNMLFRFPIWIFGKELFTSIVSVKNLYISLCVIQFSLCLLYLYSQVSKYRKAKNCPNIRNTPKSTSMY